VGPSDVGSHWFSMFDPRFDDPVSILAALLLAALLFWMFGGFVLRVGGLVLALAGVAAMAAGGGLVMLWAVIPAALMWLGGHWLFAARHGYVKSMLADLAFERLPARLQPPGS
jgi:hypothetical protein